MFMYYYSTSSSSTNKFIKLLFNLIFSITINLHLLFFSNTCKTNSILSFYSNNVCYSNKFKILSKSFNISSSNMDIICSTTCLFCYR